MSHAHLLNPTNGSWWIVQAQPTKEAFFPNPTNGSWWIVQVQPMQARRVSFRRWSLALNWSVAGVPKAGLEQSTNCRWWDWDKSGVRDRLDLNNPPTAVGGIATDF